MNALVPEGKAKAAEFDPYGWVGQVLDHFARGEQALGRITMAMGLPITNGSLGSLAEVRKRLIGSGDRKARLLEQRIARWTGNRPYRHLLAHATVMTLFDASGRMVLVTRHLPRDASDVTPDRIWTADEQKELLRQASNDSRSICDHVRDIVANAALISILRTA